MTLFRFLLSLSLFPIIALSLQGQRYKTGFEDIDYTGLKFRHIGPAFMSGRVADIAVHPENENIWYVAIGSGGIWKTENAGTTWQPIFDNQPSYSIGCIAIDPSKPHRIWAGTGENVGGRHVGYGDGIYLSTDEGKTWKNMGLKNSEHISEIIIHPQNSDIVWLAVQGKLWSQGEERGVYKTTDGGKTWRKTLGNDQWTGATDLLINPENPEILYAATWDRHRNVAAYMGGGPGSGIYKSEDGGETWLELTKGIPAQDKGKIGLAISPQNPDVLYAAIELYRRTGAVYRSEDAGESWTKQSDAVSGGTGPHYYQELYAHPHQFDLIYLADVRMQVSDDGGKNFKRMDESYKHSDNHALAFKKSDPNFLLSGTDGGLYISYDKGKTWKYTANLPVTQFYKIALDDAEPFYNIYGGTQDNNTQCGPSRTANPHGIRNADWEVVLYADGHQPATETGNPNIAYAEWQEGNLVRIDRANDEVIHIQPQPAEGEDYERFNWDAPILVSPHKATRLYFASQRVWKSEDRGDSWETLSDDLTKNQERMNLPLMGKTHGWDAQWDLYAMSDYNTITSLAESPKKEGLLYAGTDDGFICVKDGESAEWKKIPVSDLPDCPETAFVNDIKADKFDENTVYVALDNHKFGDLNPYLYVSKDKGKSWKKITSGIPERHLVWRLVQDYENPNLLFIGTEFGVFLSLDAGQNWMPFKSGMPTISVRDIAIHPRENDLVAATFGRGIYILDDISPLRYLKQSDINSEAYLFYPKDAWWYIPDPVLSFGKGHFHGNNHFSADNPPYGAVFTYYLSEKYKSKKEIRQEAEKEARKDNNNVNFPGWDSLQTEHSETKTTLFLYITDESEEVIRRIEAKNKKGFNRLSWDMRVSGNSALGYEGEGQKSKGFLAPPGKYFVRLYKEKDGEISPLSKPLPFELKVLQKGSLPGASPENASKFWQEVSDLNYEMSKTKLEFKNATKKLELMKIAYRKSKRRDAELREELYELQQSLKEMEYELYGNPAKRAIKERTNPTMQSRLNKVISGTRYSTYGPTQTHKQNLKIVKKMHDDFRTRLQPIITDKIPELEQKLLKIKAPYIVD